MDTAAKNTKKIPATTNRVPESLCRFFDRGYQIARDGLQTVRDIKDGDLQLHQRYFSSLQTVNPAIKNSALLTAYVGLLQRILERVRECRHGVQDVKQFTPQEIGYCTIVLENLLDGTINNLHELNEVVKVTELSMKDEERLKRIEVLYVDLQDKYAFCCSFSEEVALLATHRMREQFEVNLSKKLYR